MNGYRLDLARLAQESERPSDDPYLAVGRMLRDHLGGDPLAELRERCRGDPVLAEMAEIAGDLLRASPARSRRPRLTTSRRLRLLRAVDEIARQVDVASVSQPPKRSPG